MVKVTDTVKGMNSIKFICSYGGKIVPRHTDGKLRYIGGHTRVLAVDRSISFAELMVKLVEFCGSSVILRCQLPNEDLETLISVMSDEDFINIVEVYDRASSSLSHPLKIRAVLSPPKSLKTVSPPLSSPPSIASPLDFSISKLAYLRRSPLGIRNHIPAAIVVQSNSPRLSYDSVSKSNPRSLYCPRFYL